MIKNKSKYRISVAEEGSDKWFSLDLEQVCKFPKVFCTSVFSVYDRLYENTTVKPDL